VVDLRVIIYDGSYHAVDSSENSFKVAGSMAFKKGFLEANPVLLEPIYVVRVTVPDEFMGDVMGDLSSRRGKILGMEAQGPFQIIRAQVPLAELYKYSTHLRSLTQGRGHVEREFSHYEEVPREIAEKVIAETAAAKQEA
jgi:elongation factor G